MSDIVKILRATEWPQEKWPNDKWKPSTATALLCHRAADEIERLRALVDEWAPKSEQVRKVLRGKLGKRVTGPARILSKTPSSWPPSAKPPRRSP